MHREPVQREALGRPFYFISISLILIFLFHIVHQELFKRETQDRIFFFIFFLEECHESWSSVRLKIGLFRSSFSFLFFLFFLSSFSFF